MDQTVTGKLLLLVKGVGYFRCSLWRNESLRPLAALLVHQNNLRNHCADSSYPFPRQVCFQRLMKIKVSKSLVAQVANTEEGAKTKGIRIFCFVLYFAFSRKFLHKATGYKI